MKYPLTIKVSYAQAVQVLAVFSHTAQAELHLKHSLWYVKKPAGHALTQKPLTLNKPSLQISQKAAYLDPTIPLFNELHYKQPSS